MQKPLVELSNKKLKLGKLRLGQAISVDMEQSKRQDGQNPTEHNGGDVVDTYCFRRFPEEIWLAILDKLADSKDILSVLRAFPELNKPFQNKKADWLLDQVVPHLMTRYLVTKKKVNDEFSMHTLDSRELLKLRLVSKRWKHAVEMSLKNHPDRRQPLSINTSDTDGEATANKSVSLISYNRLSYQQMHKYHLGASIFHTPDHIDQFLEEMRNFQGNPFPGKSILVNPKESFEFSALLFNKKVVEMLQKFGQHVEVLEWDFCNNMDGHLETCQLILKGLSYVPKVQSITLAGDLDNWTEDYDAGYQFFGRQESQELFPALPQLETLHFRINCAAPEEGSRWMDRMKDTYIGSNQTSKLRKLTIAHNQMNVTLAHGLKDLTELNLLLFYDATYTASNIEDVLWMFPKDQIRKFGLSDYVEGVGFQDIYIDEIISILAHLNIETVLFERIRLKEEEANTSEVALSVTSFGCDDSLELSYEFLRRLPNLQNLSIYVDNDTYREFLIGDYSEKAKHSLAFSVREHYFVFEQNYAKTSGQLSIWEALPKLEILSFSVEVLMAADDSTEIMDVQYVRSHRNKPFFCGRIPAWMKKG